MYACITYRALSYAKKQQIHRLMEDFVYSEIASIWILDLVLVPLYNSEQEKIRGQDLCKVYLLTMSLMTHV